MLQPRQCKYKFYKTAVGKTFTIFQSFRMVRLFCVECSNLNVVVESRILIFSLHLESWKINRDVSRNFAVLRDTELETLFSLGPTVWNSLPDELRDPACDIDSFKQFFKTILFSQY